MAHLGDFGVEMEAVSDTFSYFGETLRTNPDLTDLAALDAFSAVHKADDTGEAVAALRNALEVLIHPEDASKCWDLAKAHRQGIAEISDLAMKLLEAATDRPTSRPSDSSRGAENIDTKSVDDSVSPALTVLEGRPDLQVAVLRAAKTG